MPSEPVIIFVDNSIHKIFKTVEVLKSFYPNVLIYNGEGEFFEYLSKHQADIIFMNLDLEPNDAVAISREIRQQKDAKSSFLVIYSDKQDDFVQELAFNSGVDSFINFHQKSAVMKIFVRNLLRRRRDKNAAVPYQKVMIDGDKYLIYKHGQPFQLPRKEFTLFKLLYTNSDKFFSKTEIANLVWEDETVAKKRTIDVHIYNIRQLFGKRIIQSQKGKGYRMNKKVIE